MINSFKSYLVEETKLVYFTFGRMNPPTIGHEKLLTKLAANARQNPYRVYLSQSQDQQKNPLQYREKVKIARKMFPKHARQIVMDPKIKNVFDVLVKLYNEGFKRAVMVVGSDRVREFDILLNKYNGQKGKHGFYNFEKIQTISAGERDPDADGAEGMSASKMRAAAKDDDFTSFSQGLPKAIGNADAKSIYNTVRKGMGLKEQKQFKNHVQLEPISDLRENYVNGMLYNIGDNVVIKETGEIANVKHLGTNYVILEGTGKTKRKWIDDIEKLDMGVQTQESYTTILGEATVRQDPDIADRKGTQPAKYHAGLSKSTKAARDRQFKKQTKMADNNPSAYKPAPGDKDAETKPSKYTKAVKKMFGEAKEHEMTVGNYTTTHYYMCPSAKKAMTKHSDVDGAAQLAKMQDDYFKFEKMFMDKEPTAEDKAKALDMYNKIMAAAKKAGIEKDVKPYMDDHRDSIIKGDPEPGFGKVDEMKEYKMSMKPTKPLRFKKMFEKDAQNATKKAIDREKERDAVKHDRMMDRARTRDTMNKNRETKANAPKIR